MADKSSATPQTQPFGGCTVKNLFGSVTGGIPGSVCTGALGLARTLRSRPGAGRADCATADAVEHSNSPRSSAAGGGKAEPATQPHNVRAGPSHRTPRSQPTIGLCTIISLAEMSAMADRSFNSLSRLRHNQIDPKLAELGARSARVPVYAVLVIGAGLQTIDPYQTRVDGERQRSVSKPRMGSDLFLRVALAFQQPRESVLARPVIRLDRVHTDGFRGPFLV